MSVAIPEDIVKETVSKTEKTEKYSAKLTPDAPPFFTSANVTKNEDTFELMKAMFEEQTAPDIEAEYFNGNPLEFYHIIDLFREAVVNWGFKMQRLLSILK